MEGLVEYGCLLLKLDMVHVIIVSLEDLNLLLERVIQEKSLGSFHHSSWLFSFVG